MEPAARVNPLVRHAAAARRICGPWSPSSSSTTTTAFAPVPAPPWGRRGGGHRRGEASDGESAVAETKRLRPEIVLLDIQLPDLDGFDVARRILAQPAPPKIVLISSREAVNYGESIEASGAAQFVTKSRLTSDAPSGRSSDDPDGDVAC